MSTEQERIAKATKELEEAITSRDEYLKDNPQLQKFQDELTASFNDFGDNPIVNIEIICEAIKRNHAKLTTILGVK